MQIKAYAKINLTLDILGKREDGYHEVSMIMQSVALHDDLVIEKAESGVTLSVEGANLPADESNLCHKAARLMLDEYKISDGVNMRLIKQIPSEAGLGGGSADAAATIRGINELFELKLSFEDLENLGAKIGSDVPFCIRGGTQIAKGRGEILEKLPDFPKITVVLAKPEISISTPWAYKTYDENPGVARPDNERVIEGIKAGDARKIYSYMGNVLENVAITKYPEIEECKNIMLSAGAIFSQMTGSGSVVFAFAKDKFLAENIARAITEKTSCKVFITETIGNNF